MPPKPRSPDHKERSDPFGKGLQLLDVFRIQLHSRQVMCSERHKIEVKKKHKFSQFSEIL